MSALENPTGNGAMTRIRNCETLRNGCESLRRHHWAVCEAARNRRESAAKPAKAPRNPRKRRESAAKKLRIRVTSSLPVGFVGLAAPAGSGRCPKEVSPPRQRRDGESQHGHVYLSPAYTCGHPMWRFRMATKSGAAQHQFPCTTRSQEGHWKKRG